MNSLLRSQIEACFGDLNSVPEGLRKFLSLVENAYEEFDAERLALRGSEDQYRALVEACPDNVVLHDRRAITFASDAGGLIRAAGTVQDLSQRRTAEAALAREHRFVRLLQSIATFANGAESAEEALQFTLDKICADIGWPVGHVYLPDQSSKNLVSSRIWSSETSGTFMTFREVTESTPLASGIGLPGRVLASGEPHWIEDVNEDANFPRAMVASGIGVKAGVAFPVLVGQEVAAVLEFFSPDSVEPDERLLEVLGHVGTQLGRVIERKRAEQALRQSEARTRLIVETAYDAFVAIDETGVIVDWNPQAEETFGWARDEAIGRPLAETIIPPRYREAHERGLRHFLKSGEGPVLNRRLELSALHRDGHEFAAELTISPVKLGESYVFNAFVHDITERRFAEEALRRSERQLAAAQNIAHLGSWEWDVAADRVTWSDELYRVFGLMPHEFGATLEAYLARVHPDERDRVRGVVEQAARDLQPFGFESRIVRPDGAVRFVESRGEVLVGADGSPERMTGVCQDITERKQAEERFKQTFELSLDMMAIAGFDGLFKRVNPGFERILGHPPHDLEDSSFMEIVHPDDRQAVQAEVQKLAQGSPTLDFEVRCVSKGGEYRWTQWNAVSSSDRSLIYAVGRDVTDRRQVEEALTMRAHELERFNRLTVGRELRMVELKRQVNELSTALGKDAPYDIEFAGAATDG